MRSTDWLNDVMELNHPVRVNEDGSVTESLYPNVYAPESNIETSYDGQISKEHEDRWTESMRRQGWEPERGWTGQDRYSGPLMHASEFVGGGLARHILETPGVWVAVSVECLRDDPDPGDLSCVYCGVSLNESDTGLYEDPAKGSPSSDTARYCTEAADHLHAPEFDNDDGEPAGWAVLHMDDTAETQSYVLIAAHPWPPRPADLANARRMTLAEARRQLPFWTIAHFAVPKLVRVTDLAVLPLTEPASQRLEAIRASLRAGNISYGELAELQGLAAHIDPGDTELLEPAGVPEHDDNPDPAANYQDGPCGDR
jgi:hypothetical protein